MVVNSGSKCNLLLGIYHPFHLCFHVIVLHMSVSIQGDANVRVSHQILQSFGIHTAFGHVGTKRMSANMRCDVGQLFPIELRFLYKGIIIKHNKTEPTYTKTSLFLCEKRRFFMARTEKGVVTTI